MKFRREEGFSWGLAFGKSKPLFLSTSNYVGTSNSTFHFSLQSAVSLLLSFVLFRPLSLQSTVKLYKLTTTNKRQVSHFFTFTPFLFSFPLSPFYSLALSFSPTLTLALLTLFLPFTRLVFLTRPSFLASFSNLVPHLFVHTQLDRTLIPSFTCHQSLVKRRIHCSLFFQLIHVTNSVFLLKLNPSRLSTV